MTTYNYPSDTGQIFIVIENIVTVRVKQVKIPYIKYENDSKGNPHPFTANKDGEVLEINGLEIGDCLEIPNLRCPSLRQHVARISLMISKSGTPSPNLNVQSDEPKTQSEKTYFGKKYLSLNELERLRIKKSKN